jgi:hypothetical protein
LKIWKFDLENEKFRLMRFCRLMFFFMLELEIVHFFDFGGFLDKNALFSTFDLENYCQGQTFSKSKYQKRVVNEKLKILSYHTHKSDVWFGL